MKDSKLFSDLNLRSMFLVWGHPSKGPRSGVLARELGIDELHYVYLTPRRDLWISAFRYGYNTVRTLWLLFRKRPQLVFYQSPPSFAVLIVYLYCAVTGSQYIVDAHSDALQNPKWTRPEGLYRFLARKALVTIVTNETFSRKISDWGGRAFILRDIPTTFQKSPSFTVNGGFNVTFVNTFARDEPLQAVLEAAAGLEGVHLYITGRKSSADPSILASAPSNVHFTDFLPDESYYALLSSSHAIMCLTTRDDTMQRGACEALSLGKPIITSDWPLLRDYFHRGTVHVTNTGQGIQGGVLEMKQNYEKYQAEIITLQSSQRQEWQVKIEELSRLIKETFYRGVG